MEKSSNISPGRFTKACTSHAKTILKQKGYSPSIQVLPHYVHVLSCGLTQQQSNCVHFFHCCLCHSHALDFAFYNLKGPAKLHTVNVIFHRIDVMVYCVGAVCLCMDSNTWMALGCLQMVLPGSNSNTCKQ